MKTHCRLLVVAALLALAPLAPAATPRDSVLRLVPGDVGFCFFLQDLRGHAQAFGASPFLAHFCKTPLAAKILKAPETAVLLQTTASIESQLGISLAQLRDDIFGDAVAVAYRPGPVDNPAEEQGVLILHARAAEQLERFVNQINVLQRKAGELKAVEACRHRTVTYHRRVLSQETNFWYTRGPLLVFTTHEAMMREVIDRHLADEPAAAAPVVRQFQRLGLEDRLAALWINPRPYDAALRPRAEEAVGLRMVPLKTLLTYWQALDGLAVSLAVREEIELVLTVRGDAERLPLASRRFLATADQASDLWRRFPADAILAVAGRVDVLAFAEMLGEFLPEEARTLIRAAIEQSVGVILPRDVLRLVLPQVGPDWGLCVFPPRPEDKGCIPPLLFALRVRRDTAATPAGQELFAAVLNWADLVAKAYNALYAGAMSLRGVSQDKVEIKYLTEANAFPTGFRPAFALKDGYLLLASSPEAIQRFVVQPAPVPTAGTGEVPFLRFSPQALRRFLSDRRAELATHLALIHQLPKPEIDQRLDNLLAVLELLDRVEVVKRSTAGQLSLALRVRPVRPLR